MPTQLKNPFAWLAVLWYMELKIHRPFNFDVIILELGTDPTRRHRPFGKYLRPDIGVVTAVAPEHMEFFSSIDKVRKEELTVANFSQLALINRDDRATPPVARSSTTAASTPTAQRRGRNIAT